MNITDLKAWEIKEKLLNDDFSCEEIIEAHFKIIEEKEASINAFISTDKERALDQAKKIDEKIKNKEELGLLAGLPIALKDNIITKDFKTTAGSKMLENFMPPFDASLVKMIEENDGIIIGKTNMDEFSIGGSTDNNLFGATKNPRDISKTPGGSSGGSAASVAANEAALSVGTDTSGSIRVPAAYCGVVAIKPTYGRISRYGIITVSNSLDTVGVIGKDVRDASLMLSAIYGKDKLDTTSLEGTIDFDLEADVKGLKVAIPKEWMALEMDPSVREDFQRSIETFKNLGAEIEEVSLPNIIHSSSAMKVILYSDISSNMARFDGIRYGFRAEEYETLDELYSRSRTEGFGENVKKSILFGTYLLSGHRGEEYYKQAQKVRTLIIEDFHKAFKDFDILIAPSNFNKPANLEGESAYFSDYSESINLAGLPAVSIPMGEMTGLQIIGDRLNEETIIKAALAFEGAVK
nr:Asp-tRNA(Asn)/Glu-tRNA(Gln) amidotransferase subunit GatA [Tissierella sp.]